MVRAPGLAGVPARTLPSAPGPLHRLPRQHRQGDSAGPASERLHPVPPHGRGTEGSRGWCHRWRGVRGAMDRLTDQDPRAPPHPILHPRGPSSCWDAGGRYPQREGGATRRGQGAPWGEGAETVPPGCQGRRVPTGWNVVRAGGEGHSRRPAPTLKAPLTGSLVFDEEQLKPLFEGVLVDVELHLDPGGRAGRSGPGASGGSSPKPPTRRAPPCCQGQGQRCHLGQKALGATSPHAPSGPAHRLPPSQCPGTSRPRRGVCSQAPSLGCHGSHQDHMWPVWPLAQNMPRH